MASSVRQRYKKEKRKRETLSDRRAFCELDETGKKIDVWFPYTLAIKNEVRDGINESHFKGPDEGGPKWQVPRDLETCEKLRNIFGKTVTDGNGRLLAGLKIGDALKAWAKEEATKRRNLGNLSIAKDARLRRITPESRIGRAINGDPVPELDLPPLPTGHPHPLMTKREPRPYQRADIKMMALADVMNANQPGVGKTIETIGSWVESGLLNKGSHLVVAPVKSLENVWYEEVGMWIPELDMWTAEDPIERKWQITGFLDQLDADPGYVGVLAVNFDWMRLVKIEDANKGPNLKAIMQTGQAVDKIGSKTKYVYATDTRPGKNNQMYAAHIAKSDHRGHKYAFRNPLQERLLKTRFATVTVDEFHKAGLNNRVSLFSLGVDIIKADKKAALSGTPMGGKPRKLWNPLRWLDPEEFGSEWRWINEWLKVSDDGHGKKVGDILDGKQERFYQAHSRRIVRRLKLDALPGLPPRVEKIIWCKMTPSQRKQYLEFEAQLEIKIDEERLSANNVLTEYMRLKQFANARQRMVEGNPFPTEDSGKLEKLWEHLDENGIRVDDPEPGARAIVGSESARMVEMLTAWLSAKGIDCDSLTGATKDSKPILEKFKRGSKEPYVIVMTVQTGGVSLNLEEAWSMHAIDETWNPDDLEQFFDRGDRGTRTTPLRCFTYRTRDSIQEYIAEVNEGKAITNKNVLDIHAKIQEHYKEGR